MKQYEPVIKSWTDYKLFLSRHVINIPWNGKYIFWAYSTTNDRLDVETILKM